MFVYFWGLLKIAIRRSCNLVYLGYKICGLPRLQMRGLLFTLVTAIADAWPTGFAEIAIIRGLLLQK